MRFQWKVTKLDFALWKATFDFPLRGEELKARSTSSCST
jgi:hypothetical protein